MLRDIVALVKPDGTRIEGIKSSVQSEQIFVHDATLPIEEGDTIERERPGGIIDRYTVLDAGYHEKFYELPAGFQMKVRKQTGISQGPPRPSNNYYLYGPNARVNNNSIDASMNISLEQTEPLFTDLRAELMQIADEAHRERLLVHVDEMQATQGTDGFLRRYQAFMQDAANHVTVVGPFLPALAQLIGSVAR